MKSLYGSIISSNSAGALSLDVFNKKIRETFEQTFKSFVYLDKKKNKPDHFGWFSLGWPVRKNKYKWNVESQLTPLLEKWLKELSVYHPVKRRVSFQEDHFDCWEIRFQNYPNEWEDEPTFYITTKYDDEKEKYWLLIDYDDIGVDDIFNQKNT